MALVAQNYTLSVTLADTAGNTTNKRYEFLAADAGEALTRGQEMLAAIDALTDAVVVGYTVGINFLETALTLPAGNVRVSNRANIVLELTGKPDDSAVDAIPAPVEAIFVAASGPDNNRVNTTATALTTFYNLFDSTSYARISDGDSVAGIRRGYRASRGVRRN